MSDWIDVKKRLPDNGNEVVIAVIISTLGPMVKLYITARIQDLRYPRLKLLKISVLTSSRTKDWVTRIPLMLSAI